MTRLPSLRHTRLPSVTKEHSPTGRLRRQLQGPLILGTLLAWPVQSLAQPAPGLPDSASDAEVIAAWEAANPGAPVPSLRDGGPQGVRIEWKGSASADRYSNHITSASGQAGTPLVTGQHFKATFSGDLRAIRPGGTMDYLQFATTHSNDPAVLPRKPYQTGTLQLGRSAADYVLALGDVAPHFSTLSSSLGVRGLLGQTRLGPLSVNAYAGQVAESWEALLERDLRTQPTRSVRGLKLEYPLGTSTKAYVTSQSYTTGSLSSPGLAFSGDTAGRSHSAGFVYKGPTLTVAGETALSSSDDALSGERSARATVVDGTWQKDKITVRAGVHDVDPGFSSLSLSVRPGIQEAYVSAEWAVSALASLGGDFRKSRQTTLGTPYAAAIESETDAATAGINFNFGPDWPGWSASVQQLHSVARAADNQRQLNQSTNLALNYASPSFSLNLGFGRGRVTNSNAPEYDADSEVLTWAVRRMFASGASAVGSWAGSIGWNGKAQIQTPANGTGLKSGDTALQLSLERSGFGSVSVLASSGILTPAPGSPSARSSGFQLEAVYLPSRSSSVKVYWRHMRLNANYSTLAVLERTTGIQLTANF